MPTDSPNVISVRPSRGPLGRLLSPLLGLFSSIWLGVTLLTLLFIYCSIGSSGLPIGPGMSEFPYLLRPDAWVSVREKFELSEFEWFHWWPFDVLIALICVNLTVATLRRIPFNVVNLGVWMIHAGIIVLALGSVWYFGTKVEGDAPVARRTVVASLPGGETVSFVASPGRQVRVGSGAETYVLQVQGISPAWELLSGADEGKRAYKVSVLVQGPQREYIRELIAGYPQYTEDLVRSDDPRQPFARAKKTLGTPLVDDRLQLSLEYAPQTYLYLMGSAAIYLREAGADEWVQRPIEDLPRFGDYISSLDQAWAAPGDTLPTPDPLDVAVPPVDPADPLPDVTFRITDSLRYAQLDTRRFPGGERLDPAVSFQLRNTANQTQDFQLLAFDPRNNMLGEGAITFQWTDDAAQIEAMRAVRDSSLEISVPGADLAVTEVIGRPDGEGDFRPVGSTPYAYRVRSAQDGLVIEGRSMSVAIVEIRRGEETFVRWVFDDPALNRDIADDGSMPGHDQARLFDDGIQLRYVPGSPMGVRIVGGPGDDDLRVLAPPIATPGAGELVEHVVRPGDVVPIDDTVVMTVTSFSARSREETRPVIIPKQQRSRDVGVQASMIRLHVDDAGAIPPQWLNFHIYPFDRPEDVLLRYPYQPTVIQRPDGRYIEIMFSRERMPLPAPVVLDDFELATHIGGYSGVATSVRDWTSVVRFLDDGTLTEPTRVSVNAPQEHDGYWFFQSQWDPPLESRGPGDPGSAGLNYTVLGVGNRNGVVTQLLGCCLSVIGMLYAFYAKPMIKRRRQEAVYAGVASRPTAAAAAADEQDSELAPVGAEETR